MIKREVVIVVILLGSMTACVTRRADDAARADTAGTVDQPDSTLIREPAGKEGNVVPATGSIRPAQDLMLVDLLEAFINVFVRHPRQHQPEQKSVVTLPDSEKLSPDQDH